MINVYAVFIGEKVSLRIFFVGGGEGSFHEFSTSLGTCIQNSASNFFCGGGEGAFMSSLHL